MRSSLLAAATALAAVACSPSGPSAPDGRDDLVVVAGTHVWMAPPEGMEPARNAAGFEAPDGRASISVLELSQPYREVSTGFLLPDNLQKQRIELVDQQPRANGSLEGVLLSGTQQGVPAVIWIFGGSTSVIVQGSSPEPERFDQVREAVLSATFDASLEVDLTDGLEFSLGDDGGLRAWQRLGPLVCFTESGTGKGSPMGEPMFTVGPVPAMPVADRAAFHRQRLAQLPLAEVQEVGTEEVVVDGLPGFASVLIAKDPATGQQRAGFQMLLFEADRHWLAIGMCHADRGEEVLPVFERMAKSLVRKPGR